MWALTCVHPLCILPRQQLYQLALLAVLEQLLVYKAAEFTGLQHHTRVEQAAMGLKASMEARLVTPHALTCKATRTTLTMTALLAGLSSKRATR